MYLKSPPSPPIQCCKPTTLLDASFAHCSSTLLRVGRGDKHKIVQIAVFPIIFVTDCGFDDITITFTDQNSRWLIVEDKVILTLISKYKWCVVLQNQE